MCELAQQQNHAAAEPQLNELVRVDDVDALRRGHERVGEVGHGDDEPVAQKPAQDGGNPAQGDEAGEVAEHLGSGGRALGASRHARRLAEQQRRVGHDGKATHQKPADHGDRERSEGAQPVHEAAAVLDAHRAQRGVGCRVEHDHEAGVRAHHHGDGDARPQQREAGDAPALEHELDGQRDHGRHDDHAAEPVVLPPEHEVAAEGEERRAEDARDGQLAVMGEDVVEQKTADEDLQRLDKHEDKREPRVAEGEPQGNKHQVKGVERPALVRHEARSQAVVEVPEPERALAHRVQQVEVVRHVLVRRVGA